VSEARSVSWRRGKKTPTLGAHARGRKTVREPGAKQLAAHVQQRSAEAFASVVKHSVPRSIARSPRLRGVSTRRKSRSELGTHEVWVHVNRSGGRSRSYASRVSFVERSQGLLKMGALARRKLEAPPDAGHEWVDGEMVRGKALTIKKVRAGSACGFRLASSRYDGRRSRAFARLALTGTATRGPSARR